MAKRERQRAKRKKRKERKERSAERRRRVAEQREAMAARSEAKNEAARQRLQPLREDERPTVVTIGAVIAALVSLSVIAGYAAGVEVTAFSAEGVAQGEERPHIVQVLVPATLFAIMAWGMWRARYWAVLGFQVALLFALIAASLGLVQATEITQAIGNFVLLAVAGTMFFFMIKALARIQMPKRLPRE
jgi:hypothetical protein